MQNGHFNEHATIVKGSTAAIHPKTGIGSMRRRCTACIQNNGGHTRYWKGTDFAPSAVMYWWNGLSWSKTWHVINKMPMFQLAIVGLFYFELLPVQFYYISNKCVWVYIRCALWRHGDTKTSRFCPALCVRIVFCINLGVIAFELCDLWRYSLTQFMQNTMRAHSAGQISMEGTWSIPQKLKTQAKVI